MEKKRRSMKRREALKLTAGLIGTSIIGAELFLLGCADNAKSVNLFSDTDIILLDEIGEVILPRTEQSPGAKDAKIGLFMNTIVTDCYDKNEQQIFINGINKLNQMSQNKYSADFIYLTKEQKHHLIDEIDRNTRDISNEEVPHFFPMIKQLTIWGYFTSEPGATKALRYNQVPGKFIGCIPYTKGDKAWS